MEGQLDAGLFPDSPTLGIGEDRIVPPSTRMAALVEAQNPRRAAARMAAMSDVGDVNAAGAGTVRGDVQRPHRVGKASHGFFPPEGRPDQGFELGEQSRECRARGSVELVGRSRKTGDEDSRRARQHA